MAGSCSKFALLKIMTQPPLFFALSGPSGIGKTTTLRILTDQQREFGFELHLPVKITARPPKPTDNPAEMTYASQADFEHMKSNGKFLVDYDRHGNRYGLLRPESLPGPNGILIQAMPPAISNHLKMALADQFRIITIRLEASAEVIGKRLTGRNDKISGDELASRHKTALKPAPSGIDHMVDANAEPFIVARRVSEAIKLHL